MLQWRNTRGWLFVLFSAVLPLSAATSNITVNPSVTYATWKYWMALISAPVGFGGTPAEDPNWPSFKPQFLNQLVNQLGINTIQLTEPSGDIENSSDCWTKAILMDNSQSEWSACRYSPVNDDNNPAHFNCADAALLNCPTSFPLSYFDYTMSQYITGPGGMRALVQANGEPFHLVLQWIHWPKTSGYLDQTAAEAGEQILAVFLHSQNKFGFTPDIVDLMVEPDNHADNTVPAADVSASGVWDPAKLGKAASAIKSRLNAAGFHPEIWCCSVSRTSHAVDWYTGTKAAAGANVIDGLTTHWYDESNAYWGAIQNQASSDRIPMIMTEFDMAGMDDLYNMITQGNIAGFERYTAAGVSTTDNASVYFMISSTNPYASHYLGVLSGADSPTYFMPQYMHYIREGDVREQAVSDNACAAPIAFRSPAGLDKIAVRITCTGNQTVNVVKAAAGTYGCTYTLSNSVLLQPCGPDQTISQGGTLTALVPATGVTYAVVTFFARSTIGAPVIAQGGVVPVFSASSTIQPGSWISIYGSDLAAGTTIWNNDFPTSLGGVSVTVNGKPGYLWFVSPGQVNLQAPDDTTTGQVNVVVTTATGTSSATVSLAAAAPSFSLLDSVHVAGVIATPNGSGAYGNGSYDLLGPPGQFDFSTRAVKPGETLELFGVGFGPTTPTVKAGAAFNGSAPTANKVSVTIGGVPAQVAYSGITQAGVYQINVVVPDAGSGDQLLQATVAGATTPASVYVTLP